MFDRLACVIPFFPVLRRYSSAQNLDLEGFRFQRAFKLMTKDYNERCIRQSEARGLNAQELQTALENVDLSYYGNVTEAIDEAVARKQANVRSHGGSAEIVQSETTRREHCHRVAKKVFGG